VAALEGEGIHCTRSQLARAFRAGAVTSEEKRLKPGRVVDAPLAVDVQLAQPEPLAATPEDLPLQIVFEDDDLLVVDKAAGMVVHAGPGHPRGTLVNAVLFHLGTTADGLPVLPGNDATRPGIVHRLDRNTSGLLVVAKHARAQTGLAAQFRAHSLDREYRGVVVGVPSWSELSVETGHGRDPANRLRFAPLDAATRRATSHCRQVQALQGAAVVGFRLETGRTHQIRMHARHLGHPIVGDTLYAQGALDGSLARAATELGRQALHAAVLGFEHPVTGKAVRFESALPPDIASLIATLSATTC